MTRGEGAFAQLQVSERAPIYAWLSRLLVCEIRAADWDAIRSGPITGVLTQLEPKLAEDLGRPLSAEQEERLAEEFARLFLLPGGVSPFASSWIALRNEQASDDRLTNARSSGRTREAIAERVAHGLRLLGREPLRTEPWGRLPLDHFGVVLDLVSQAALAGRDVAHHTLAIQLERELLSPCLTAFGMTLRRQSRQPVYRAIGGLIAELETSTTQPHVDQELTAPSRA